MSQSRQTVFFGAGRFSDDYDGRLESLTYHMSIYIKGLEQKQGEEFDYSQALFDVMVNDFDVALREEGMTDAGVKRRIRPMVAYFYKRMMVFSESLASKEDIIGAIRQGKLENASDEFLSNLSQYYFDFHRKVETCSISELADFSIQFPELKFAENGA